MRAQRPLRIPLQIGTSALSSLVWTAMWFIPGSLLVGIPLTVLIAIGATDIGDAAGYIFFPGLFCSGMAWKYLLRARRQRPSDLLLTPGGFEIHGGPNAGRRLVWAELTKVSLETPKKKDAKEDDDSDLKQLCVYRAGNERIELAAADRPSEQRSFVELARTIEAGRGALPEYQQRTAVEADATALLVCPSCAAAVSPTDAETVVCPFCQATVPVTTEVRQKLRDAADFARRPDAAVSKLLEQPGAGFVSAILGVGAVFMLTAWPAAFVLATLNYLARAFTFIGAGYLALFVVASVVGFFGLIRGRLVDRQALRLVALDFGAIPPTAAGKPYLCRRCLAPLPPRTDQVLMTCVYCRSDNILGIDLHRDANVAREESESLATALKRRNKERRRWRGVSLAGVGLLVLAGYSLRHGIGRNEKTWPLEQRCEQRDLDGCLELADQLSLEASDEVQVDHARATKLYRRACDAGRAHGCAGLAAAYLDRYSKLYDRKEAQQLQIRACDLGDADSCREAGRH